MSGTETSSVEQEVKGNNPYRLRVSAFPGRLFPDTQPEQEIGAVRAIAANASTVYAELGSGSGLHLLEVAKRNPQSAVFGFEMRFKRAVRTLEKAEAQRIENAYVLRTKGEKLGEFFPKQSLAGVFVNYPDPWPKSRWHKHRILSAQLLDSLTSLLVPGGFLSVKTDHHEYFETFLATLSEHSAYRIVAVTRDLQNSEYFANNVPTEFENLFISLESKLCHLRCELIASD